MHTGGKEETREQRRDVEVQEKMRGKVEAAAREIRGLICHKAMKDGKKREGLRERKRSGWKGNYGNEGERGGRDRNADSWCEEEDALCTTAVHHSN